jgi:hypothetical protein
MARIKIKRPRSISLETEPTEENNSKRPRIHATKIEDVNDLIALATGTIYASTNINITRLRLILPALRKLQNLIGLHEVKKAITGQILFFVQDLHDKNNDMLHTVIQGAPGVGKTMLGRILGEIYSSLGVIENPKSSTSINRYLEESEAPKPIFNLIKRDDLIAKYLGQTAHATQAAINKSLGGVMFIDEAYSLGNKEQSDSYSKECIDTLNQNLTEKKNQFVCIIAGYKEDLDKCFFSYNEGLRRRFPFVYNIDKYSSNELGSIFALMANEIGWKNEISSVELNEFFDKHYDSFPNMAGDMESLLFHVKIEHAKLLCCDENKTSKTITLRDLTAGYEAFTDIQKKKPSGETFGTPPEGMYL